MFLSNLICSAQTDAEEKENLKKVAFCQCVYKAFEQDSISIGNEGSGSAYLEKGTSDIDVYLKALSFANQFVENSESQYKSKNGRSLALMRCLDLLHSKELDSLLNGWP